MEAVPAIAATLLLVVAAASDIWLRIIPNWVSAGIAAAAVIAILIGADFGPWWLHLAVGLCVFGIGAGLFAVGAFGGGDVKLLAAVCLWAGWAGLPTVLTITAIAGGVLGLAVWLWALAQRLVANRHEQRSGERALAPTVPYGVAIALGGLTATIGHV